MDATSLYGSQLNLILDDVQWNYSRSHDFDYPRCQWHLHGWLQVLFLGLHQEEQVFHSIFHLYAFLQLDLFENHRFSILPPLKCVHQQATTHWLMVHHSLGVSLLADHGLRAVWYAFVLDFLSDQICGHIFEQG